MMLRILKNIPLFRPLKYGSILSRHNSTVQTPDDKTNKIICNDRITTLSNGLTIATKNNGSSLSAIGAFIKAGSRHCKEFPLGITQIVKNLAFKGTEKYPEVSQVGDEINACRGALDCQTSRDLIIYALMFAEPHLEKAVCLLADGVLRPKFDEERIETAKDAILSEIENEQYECEPEKSFTELRYQASYGENGLGIKELPTLESAKDINSEAIHSYYNSLYLPDRIVIAAVNVDHDILCGFVDKFFDFKTTFSGYNKLTLTNTKKGYVGGMALKVAEKPRIQPGHVEFPELAHVSLGFEGFSDKDPRLYAAFVMHGVLGSGRSFSSGGPGKGLYTRLNQNVLYRYAWVNSCISEIMSFNDTGIFNIYGSCEPSKLNNFLNVILDQYYSILKTPIDKKELSRAKNQILSLALSGLEQTSVLLEDLGRNVSSLKKIVHPDEVVEKINMVTSDDVASVCGHILNTPPSISVLGQVDNIVEYEKIQNAIKKRQSISIETKFTCTFPFFK